MATFVALAATRYAAADTWDNSAGSGLWSGSNNWVDNTEPTSADPVIFPTPIPLGDSSIALSAGEQCANITFNDNYSLGGNNLQLFGAGGNITVASGKTATISSSIIGSVGLTKAGSGTLTLSPIGSNTFTGDVAITGTLAITKDTSLGNAANTILIGPGITTGTLQTTLSLTMSRSISPGIFGGTISANSGTTLTINGALGGSTNPLTISGQGTVSLGASSSRSGSTTIQNGTVRLNNGAALGTGGITVSASGTLETTGGSVNNFLSMQPSATLRGNSSTSYAGTISVAGSSSVTLTTVGNSDTLTLSSYTDGSGSITHVTGSGTVALSDANSYSGGWTIDSRFSILSGASVSSTIDAVSAVIGSILGSGGTATVTGTGATWTNSSQFHIGESGTGTLNIQSGGSVSNAEGYLAFNTGSSGTATISGTGSTWTNSGLTVGYRGTATLTIDPGATVTSSSGTFMGFLAGSSGTATIAGPNATWNTGDLVVGDDGTGTLTVQSGGHVSSGQSLLADNIVASHGTATVTGAGSTWTNTGGLTVGASGPGSLSISAGGSVSNTAGSVGFGPGSSVVTVDGAGSAWTNSGDLSVGVFGPGNLMIQSGASVSSSSGHLGGNLFGGTGTGTATVTGSGSKWMIGGPLRVGVGGTGTLMVQSGASVSSGGDGTVNCIIGVISGGSGAVTVIGAGSTWTNTGNVFVGDQGSGTLIVSDNGTVSASETIFVKPTGIIKGDGNINAAVSNSGVVAPGNSPGALHIGGTYTQTSGGSLKIELAGTVPGTGYDQLLVSGAASLAGTLDVSLLGGFKPATGSAFDVVVAGSRSGTFGTPQLPDLGGRIEWNTTYTATKAAISVLATYYAGDINRDSLVNIADVAAIETALTDLSTYQATHGPGGGALSNSQLLLVADLSGDNLATNADLQGLINLLANGGGNGSVSAVPEPPAFFLAVIALACTMAQRAACFLAASARLR